MRRRVLLVRLIVPALLVVLVGVLAVFQYRWLTQVSNAERDRQRAWLRQHAQGFADEFDREIARLYLALQNESPTLVANEPEAFARHYDAWRERARFPQILRALYYVDTSSGQPAIREYRVDHRAFVDTSWPAELAPIRASLSAAPSSARGEGGRGLVFMHPPIISDIPALVITLPSMRALPNGSRGEPRALITVGLSPIYLVAHLDRSVITTTVLPALMAQYFQEHDADVYRLAIVDRTNKDTVVASKNVTDASPIDQAHADATVPLFALRLELLTQVVTRTERAGGAGGGAVTALARPGALPRPADGPSTMSSAATIAATIAAGASRAQTFQVFVDSNSPKTDVLRMSAFGVPSWQLILQHSAGSLEAAVTQTRRRNLWVSFGILAVLASGIGLVVANSQRAQRLAAQQMDFVATVSHELRTPLAVIRSAAQNLSAGVVQDSAQAKQYGDLIETEGRRLTRTVDQVLEYAGFSGARRASVSTPTDVPALVRDIASAVEGRCRAAGVELAVDVARDLPAAAIDPDALRRALDNLIANAIKYGADGRWIGLTARQSTSRGRTELQIAVADHGRGIEAADLPHIFEPFYRGRHAIERQIDGSGLGLSLVKKIVEVYGGRVTVDSTRGQGTTFTLYVPIAAGDAAHAVGLEPATRPQ